MVLWHILGQKTIAFTMNEQKWYVLKVVSGQEKKVKSRLEAELESQRVERHVAQIFIHEEKVYEKRAGKRKVKEKNFFPGYMHLCADL